MPFGSCSCAEIFTVCDGWDDKTPVIHVLDASRSVTVVGALLSHRKADYVEVKSCSPGMR